MNSPKPSQLETARLILRPWCESDLAPFAALNQDPQVMEFFPKTLTGKESNLLVRSIQDHFQRYGYGPWAAELKGENKFIGFIGLFHPIFQAHFTPCVEIAWRLARDAWGKGLATEGGGEALRFAFKDLGLEEVVAFTPTGNRRSQAVMERLGMTHSLQDDFDHPLLPEGNPLRRHVLYRKKTS